MENKTVDINIPAGGLRMPLDNGAGGPQPVMIHDIILKVSMGKQLSMPVAFCRGLCDAGPQSSASPCLEVISVCVVKGALSPAKQSNTFSF